VKWIPSWLGKAYSRLYTRFKEEPFDIPSANRILGCEDGLSRTILSRLRGAYLVSIFSRVGRRRLYRLLDPETWVILCSFDIRNLEGVRQGVYFNLICKCIRSLIEKYGDHLFSIVLYGSVARGTARSSSDVDLLVISDGFKGTVGSRIDELIDVEEPFVKGELFWLGKRGIHTDISYLPLRPEEAVSTHPIYLDLTCDAIILYDRGGFFEGILDRLRDRLARLKSKRVYIGEDDWYWVLKPEVKRGEVVEI